MEEIYGSPVEIKVYAYEPIDLPFKKCERFSSYQIAVMFSFMVLMAFLCWFLFGWVNLFR